MSEFLAMGGYAVYVWPSYGLVSIVLWLNWYLPRLQHKKLLAQINRRKQAEQQ